MTVNSPRTATREPPTFLHAGDDRVWCVRCKGWKATDGEDDPCPADVVLVDCPIQLGDESQWKAVTVEQAQEALDALAKEFRELDDSFGSQPAERVALAAQRFCRELQEDADGVPAEELGVLHQALDEWESAP